MMCLRALYLLAMMCLVESVTGDGLTPNGLENATSNVAAESTRGSVKPPKKCKVIYDFKTLGYEDIKLTGNNYLLNGTRYCLSYLY